MSRFLALTEFLVAISVVVVLLSSYLIVNKLWKRRAVKEVAESISISAALMGLATGLPFFVEFVFIDHSYAPAAKSAIGILTGMVFVVVGTGVWVSENRGVGFLRLFARALDLERHESGDLFKALVQPKGADRILTILHKISAIDRHLDEREIELIRDFAGRWKIAVPDMEEGQVDHYTDLSDLRNEVVGYLGIHPPHDQVAQLVDVLHLVVNADAKVTREEELALEELTGLLEHYVEGDASTRTTFEVLIVPQTDAQVEAVEELIPGTEMKELRGGRVFSVGKFFSPRYAEVMCEKYIALGLFTTQVTS